MQQQYCKALTFSENNSQQLQKKLPAAYEYE